jgi:hypothetical protein
MPKNDNCKSNKFIDYSFSIVFQVVFIAIFLTLFFFYFVSGVEQEEFVSQMDIIVDKILKPEMIENLANEAPDAQEAALVISGAIAVAEQITIQDSQADIETIQNMNEKTKSRALGYCWVFALVVLFSWFIFLSLNYCMPIVSQVREALWVTLFVGLTELLFLEVISKHYISADPNKVRLAMADGITKWTSKCCNQRDKNGNPLCHDC